MLADGGATRTDLEAIAVGTGPGPYTGLRAGLVTARVLASALEIPVQGVCTLDVMARAAVPAAAGQEFIVAADARRKEVYWARYSPRGQRLSGPEVSVPGEIAEPGPVAGEGPVLYPELAERADPASLPRRRAAGRDRGGRLAGTARLEPAEPLYLRRPDARVPGKPKRVTP